MALTGLESILIPVVTVAAGFIGGKAWGIRKYVNKDMCVMIHKNIDEKLERISKKLDKINGNNWDGKCRKKL